jgi:deoxyadenosine/deoxycytidine kinase
VLEEIRHLKPEWFYHDEPVESWRSWEGVNYLERFYSDPQRYAYEFQQVVLTSYVEVLSSNESGIHIYERSPRSSIAVFSRAALEAGHMTNEQFNSLVVMHNRLFPELGAQLTCQNMPIYLRVDPEVAMKRLQDRGREEERGFSLDYMKQLHKHHELEYYPFPKSFVVDEMIGEVLSVEQKAEMIVGWICHIKHVYNIRLAEKIDLLRAKRQQKK